MLRQVSKTRFLTISSSVLLVMGGLVLIAMPGSAAVNAQGNLTAHSGPATESDQITDKHYTGKTASVSNEAPTQQSCPYNYLFYVGGYSSIEDCEAKAASDCASDVGYGLACNDADCDSGDPECGAAVNADLLECQIWGVDDIRAECRCWCWDMHK